MQYFSNMKFILIPHRNLWNIMIGLAIYGFGIGLGISAPFKMALKCCTACGFEMNINTITVLSCCVTMFFTFGSFLGPITGGALTNAVGFSWALTIFAVYLVLVGGAVIVDLVIAFVKQQMQEIKLRRRNSVK